MREDGLALLAHWGNFYVITGSAAAALTGLQFVVITLNAQLQHGGSEEIQSAFGSPTIVHFCAVLLLAPLLSAPWPSLRHVAYMLGTVGILGLVYAAVVLRAVQRQNAYQPVLEDWVWHFTLPPIAYATLLVASIMLQRHPEIALFVVSGTVLLLLFIGIHNAWDAATFIGINASRSPERQEDES